MPNLLPLVCLGFLLLSLPGAGPQDGPHAARRAALAFRLDPHFQDHMVLQRGRTIPVTGDAPGAAWVQVAWGETGVRAEVEDGRFRALLPPLVHGGPHPLVLETSRGDRERREDVWVGDVWLVSGQSNAAMVLEDSEGGPLAAQAAARLTGVRGLTVQPRMADAPERTFAGSWARPTPETALKFSALGFYLAEELFLATGVPQGVIVAALGDTTGEGWVSKAALLADPTLAPLVHNYEELVRNHDRVMEEYERALEAFHEQNRQREAAGEPPSRRPPRPPLGPDNHKRPWGLREGTIAPLFHLPVRAVVWYQGESNATRAAEYEHILRALFADWRAGFGDPTLPFLLVQHPGFGEPGDSSAPGHWARLREAQRRVFVSETEVGLAIAVDLGEADMHAKRKRPAAERVAVLARRLLRGEPPGASGPVPSAFEFQTDGIRIPMAEVEGGGLAARGPLDNFELRDENGRWWPAAAQIDGDAVVVRRPGLRATAVRYAWLDHPAAPLTDRAGRAASPFNNADDALSVGP